MSQWPEKPNWSSIDSINLGQQYTAGDGVTYDAFNKFVQNLQYLYNQGAESASISYVTINGDPGTMHGSFSDNDFEILSRDNSYILFDDGTNKYRCYLVYSMPNGNRIFSSLAFDNAEDEASYITILVYSDAIWTKYHNTFKGFATPTTSDNGKVLMVVNGKPEWVTISEGENAGMAYFITGTNGTIDATEYNKITSGTRKLAYVTSEAVAVFMQGSAQLEDGTVIFIGQLFEESGFTTYQVTLLTDRSWTLLKSNEPNVGDVITERPHITINGYVTGKLTDLEYATICEQDSYIEYIFEGVTYNCFFVKLQNGYRDFVSGVYQKGGSTCYRYLQVDSQGNFASLELTISSEEDYILTPDDKAEIAEMVDGATIVQAPKFVDSVEEMTDTSRVYILNSTGTIWAYKSGATVIQTIKEQITGTWEQGRLGSNGLASAQSGYVITPYIDLTKYSVPFELHLGGIQFAGQSYNTCSQYKTDKTHIQRHDTNATAFITYWSGAKLTDNGNGSVTVSFTPPVTNKSVEVGYVRFTGYGTEANADVYITYQGEVSDASTWVDTGVVYGSGEIIPSMTEFSLVNSSVKAFIESADYTDGDYSYTQITEYTGEEYYRKDLPFPVLLGWNKNENAVQYVVSIDGKLYYSSDNNLAIYNLVPNTIYNYKVTALRADGTKVVIKSGSIKTTAEQTRMLNIDGIQNVRDIGGYAGLNSKKVKYGLLFRGCAMDEDIQSNFRITDTGKQEMVARVGIKTDLDLRHGYTESALGVGVDLVNTSSGYESYSNAITNATQRGNFKALLESIVTQLTANKPIYIHCSGGNDRTGTFVFLLLGLLGVSESDLAKEYELSSFSKIGQGRRRDSTTYDYKGMVAAIKVYSGTTFSDKFYDFAKTGCNVSDTAISAFRNLMLE